MTFHLSGLLLRFTDYQREVSVEANTLAEAVSGLVSRYPSLGPVLRDKDAGIRKTHRLFLNGDLVASDALNLPVRPEDKVEILTAIAGG